MSDNGPGIGICPYHLALKYTFFTLATYCILISTRIRNYHIAPSIDTLLNIAHGSTLALCVLRCSWSTACRRCSNYIFILNLIPGFNGLSEDNSKRIQQTFKFWDLVRLILEVLRYS